MIEKHPLEPFLPQNAKVLMLGSFPPPKKRWKIPFYYPNFQNDMWRIFGLVFFDNKNHFIDIDNKTFKLQLIVDFLTQRGIAIYDTATQIERKNNDASDANLSIIEKIDLSNILSHIPQCNAIICTGNKSAEIIASILGTKIPEIGSFFEAHFGNRMIKFYRMPSTSRAYPMKIDKKAEIYGAMREIIK